MKRRQILRALGGVSALTATAAVAGHNVGFTNDGSPAVAVPFLTRLMVIASALGGESVMRIAFAEYMCWYQRGVRVSFCHTDEQHGDLSEMMVEIELLKDKNETAIKHLRKICADASGLRYEAVMHGLTWDDKRRMAAWLTAAYLQNAVEVFERQCEPVQRRSAFEAMIGSTSIEHTATMLDVRSDGIHPPDLLRAELIRVSLEIKTIVDEGHRFINVSIKSHDNGHCTVSCYGVNHTQVVPRKGV